MKARDPLACKLLLQAGADPDATSIDEPEGNNLLSTACRRNFFPRGQHNGIEICKLLLQYGARVNKRCIIEAVEAQGAFLALFMRHILTQPIGNEGPNLYVNGCDGRKPVYLAHLAYLFGMVEERYRMQVFGEFGKALQAGGLLMFNAIVELFTADEHEPSFPTAFCSALHEIEIQEKIKTMIELSK